jgi:uroporphyrinogen-III decarboxylase
MTDTEHIQSFHARLAIKRTMEVRREESLDYMTFRANARPLFTEIFGPLVGVKAEWAAQGAAPAELDFSAFRYRSAMDGHVPVHTGWLGGPPVTILEETEDQLTYRDSMGRRMQMAKRTATFALPLDHPVRTMDDWRKVKHHYEFSEQRFERDWDALARSYRQEGQVVTVGIPGGFDEPRQLMGEEELCCAYHEQPALIHDILRTIGDTAYRVLDRVSSTVPVDQLVTHEDMAGNSGPLAGPAQVREFITPYYRRIWNMLQERGARLFSQDSDGDMRPVIPAFLDAGVNLMYPCEPTAGMDIVQLREQYGTRLAFMGGLDKHVLRRSREEIVAELEYKIPPMIRTGGCVLGLDHRIPNGTPLANYRFYIDNVWAIIARAA